MSSIIHIYTHERSRQICDEIFKSSYCCRLKKYYAMRRHTHSRGKFNQKTLVLSEIQLKMIWTKLNLKNRFSAHKHENFELSILWWFHHQPSWVECMYFCIIRVCMKLKSKANVWIKHNNNKLNTTMQWESFIDDGEAAGDFSWNIFDFFINFS